MYNKPTHAGKKPKKTLLALETLLRSALYGRSLIVRWMPPLKNCPNRAAGSWRLVGAYAAPLVGPPGGDGLAATRLTRAGRGGWAGRARHAGRQVLGAMRRARLVPSILRPARAVVWLVLRAQGVGVRPAGRMRQPRVHRFRLLRAGLRRGPNPNPNPNQAAAQAYQAPAPTLTRTWSQP